MSETNDDLTHVQRIFEFLFRGVVESGFIEVGDRTPEEIFDEFRNGIGDLLKADDDFYAAIDHRETLLDQARNEARANHDELAVTLYAIWIEHFVNGILTRAFERKGYDDEVFIPLIKELRLPTKASALWALVDLPTLRKETLRLLDRVIEFRNAFVHYKWLASDENAIAQRRDQLRAVVEESEQLVAALFETESAAFWNGRHGELINRLREDVRRRWEEGAFIHVFPVDGSED